MTPSPAWKSRAEAALGWLVLATAALALQLIQSVPFDGDTGYHFAVATLLRQHGILRAFPWTAWSWLADNYSDKELLFHLLIVPFTSLGYKLGCRVVGTICGTLVLGTIYSILRAEKVRWALLWPLFALACSGGFVQRFALVRPHLLAITLTLWITWAASRRRLGQLAIASFLFPLAYVAWHQALGLVVLAEIAQRLAGQRVAWKPLAVVAGGLLLGVLAHPNFPNTFLYFWAINVEVLIQHAWSDHTGFEMGGEFRPLKPLSALLFLGIPIVATIASASVTARRRKGDAVAVAFTLATLGYLVITLRTQRFLEYFVPFAAVGAGLASRAISGAWAARAAPVALAGSGLFTALFGSRPILQLTTRTDLFADNVVEALRKVVPPEQKVFTCDWEFTGEMMVALPDRVFMISVDPVLFWKKDPERYRTWFSITRDPPENPGALVKDTFGTRYVMCNVNPAKPKWEGFIDAMDRDPSVRRLGQIGVWSVFDLAPVRRKRAPAPPPEATAPGAPAPTDTTSAPGSPDPTGSAGSPDGK